MQPRIRNFWPNIIVCGNEKWFASMDKLNQRRNQRTVRTPNFNVHENLIFIYFRHFSENNVRAMDETWYKRAVDQHSIEPESFVFSVPFDVGSYGKPLITATHAVFVEHKGHRAPAAVVGLQYQHSTLASHFLNITSKVTQNDYKNFKII